MARCITLTLSIHASAQIILESKFVTISDIGNGCAVFMPETRDDANAQAIALRLAAKRLEDIGKELD